MTFKTEAEINSAEIGRIIGKREMLWSIQRQILGAKKQNHEVNIDNFICNGDISSYRRIYMGNKLTHGRN